jgi:hypothetical protein
MTVGFRSSLSGQGARIRESVISPRSHVGKPDRVSGQPAQRSSFRENRRSFAYINLRRTAGDVSQRKNDRNERLSQNCYDPLRRISDDA